MVGGDVSSTTSELSVVLCSDPSGIETSEDTDNDDSAIRSDSGDKDRLRIGICTEPDEWEEGDRIGDNDPVDRMRRGGSSEVRMGMGDKESLATFVPAPVFVRPCLLH